MLWSVAFHLFNREPRSGSELVNEIEEYAEWRPSPGSICPRLSAFAKRRRGTPVESGVPSLTRYALSERGRAAFEAHRTCTPEARSRFHSIQKIQGTLFEAMDETLVETQSRVLNATEHLFPVLMSRPETSSTVQQRLHAVVEQIEDVAGPRGERE